MFPYTLIRITHRTMDVETIGLFADYDDAAGFAIGQLESWTFEATTYVILENNQILYKESYNPED